MVRPSSADVDWLAAGNEPGWRIEIDEGTLLDYTGDYGALRIMTPAPATELLPGGGRRWSVVTEGHRLTLELSPVACTDDRSEEHTSELQSLMRISYAVFCLKKKKKHKHNSKCTIIL